MSRTLTAEQRYPTLANLRSGNYGMLFRVEAQEILKELNAHQELIDACTALFDAPHQEHFAVRLNDEEMAALDRIKFILER